MSTNPGPRHSRPGARRVTRATLSALAAGSLLLGACGGDDASDSQEEPAVTATTPPDSGDGDSASSRSDAEALVGTWAPPNGREQTFTADGEFFVTADGEVLAEGTWTATPTTVDIIPGSGAIACDQTGTYEWEVEGDTLTFTVVEDECTGRKEGLDGVPRERVETASSPGGQEQGGDEDPVSLGQPGDVFAGDTVETPKLGGLRFVVPEDRFIYQAPGLVALEWPGLAAAIDVVAVVETLDGEPIDSIDEVVSLIDAAAAERVEVDPTTIAGHEARVYDFIGEKDEGEPRPEDAVFRFEEGGIGGWGPVGQGRVWLLDTPRGILLLDAWVFDPDAAEVADVIAEAEAMFATLELVDA